MPRSRWQPVKRFCRHWCDSRQPGCCCGYRVARRGTNTTLGITTGANAIGTIAATGNVTLSGTTVLKLAAGTNDVVQAGGQIVFGGTLKLVSLSASPVAGESYKVFTATRASGEFTNIIPATPGLGLAWDLSQLDAGRIGVVSVPFTLPTITETMSGPAGLVFAGTGGVPGQTFQVLSTTNLSAPLGYWRKAPTPLTPRANLLDQSRQPQRAAAVLPAAPQLNL